MVESAYLSMTTDSRQLQSIPHHAPSSPLRMEAIFAAAKDLYPRVMDCSCGKNTHSNRSTSWQANRPVSRDSSEGRSSH